MSTQTFTLHGIVVRNLSPALETVLRHLCESDCHAFGDLIEWCETRGDCTIAVICPMCEKQFLIDEDDLAMLETWTQANGIALGCGVTIE